jgi:hypothetical protein
MTQIPEMTRRVFLHRTLQKLGAAAALPLVAGAAESGKPSAEPVVDTDAAAGIPPLRFLTRDQYVALEAITDTMIPRGGAFELGALEVGVAARIDSYLPRLDPAVTQGFRGALVFVEQQAPSLAGKAVPFSSLSEADRIAVCSAMLQVGGLPAGIFLAMKSFSLTYFYTLDATWKYTGYDGPMLLEDAR